jgi:prolyl oligopeptidase
MLATPSAACEAATEPLDDPYLWLEDVHGEPALAWVRARNAESETLLRARPEYAPTHALLLAALNSKDRIPAITRRGDFFYNLWRDEEHKRGLWRRTPLAEYRRTRPAWETVLDLDALAAAEGENWVWAGATSLAPAHARCLVMLSRGGADASVVREFDTVGKRFVDGGFVLPEAKSEVTWIDADTLYVATDFGPGTLTTSGYPRVIKRWQRGTPLAAAEAVFEGEATDVSVGVAVYRTPGFERTVFSRSLDFYNQRSFLLHRAQEAQATHATTLLPFDVPSDAAATFWNHAGGRDDTLLLELRSDLVTPGRTYPQGSLLAADAAAYLRGERRFDVLFEPTATRSLAGFTTTRSCVIVNVLDNVASRLEEWQRSQSGFERREVAAPFPGTLGAGGLADPMLDVDSLAENYLLSYADFVTPESQWLARTGTDDREPLKALPAMFDATGITVQQQFATSTDGTRVPYFVVWPRGRSEATPADGSTPVLMYGYGGFEIPLNPWYSTAFGGAWVARGGAFVVANIRGGGEFGPAWHQAATRERKQRSYDDFIAVAEDLIRRRITSPKHLGIEGGSNGGLLVGATLIQRPDLFNAVVCSVPLLDMRRYHRLLAGASWVAEFGDPDLPADWAFISRYSPYQNVKPGVAYPTVLFTTSTRDDRVHPGHARKMAARMIEFGSPVLYFENIEGGHGGAADNDQAAHLQALQVSFMWQQLGP